jgi:mersacidin/lichenicidin family type 2 lantibiotic
MSPVDIIRAWKSEEYRRSLSASERAALPAHPAGMIELTEAELETVAGGAIKTRKGSGGGCGTGNNCSRFGGCGTGAGTGGNCSKVACCQPKTKKLF